MKLKLPVREIGCDANVVGFDRMVGEEDKINPPRL